jgi:hypothetical protein
MHFTRQQIIDKSLELGGNKDLLAKGMATNGKDVFCIISHAGAYADGEYYLNGVEHPQTIDYFGIYPVNYKNPLHSSGSESKKNICVINTKNNDGFVFVFERVSKGND